MGWKIYTLAIYTLCAASWLTLPSARIGLMDVVDIPVTLIGLIGLLAFSFRKRLVGIQFWRFWAISQVIWFLFYYGFNAALSHTIIVGIIQLPLYIGLYLYGFRSPAIWEEDPVAEHA